jgi:micrococcal nuclease
MGSSLTLYEYNAVIRSVYDGDTCRADIDLGFGIWTSNQSLRLLGIDAPELGKPGGKEARDYLRQMLPIGATVVIRTVKDEDDKYGRLLASIVATGPNGAEVDQRQPADDQRRPCVAVLRGEAMRRGANRIRNKALAEEAAYQEARGWEIDRKRREREQRSIAAGFHYPGFSDPWPPRQCPTCGALVSLSGVDLHIAWHEEHP